MFLFLLFVIEFTDVEGYRNFIAFPRKYKRNVDFFEVDIDCETKTICGVCYDINRLPLLQKLKKTLSVTGLFKYVRPFSRHQALNG